jgi:hypothetical protein
VYKKDTKDRRIDEFILFLLEYDEMLQIAVMLQVAVGHSLQRECQARARLDRLFSKGKIPPTSCFLFSYAM